MRNEKRDRVWPRPSFMSEVDVNLVDTSDELRSRVQGALLPAPIVMVQPVSAELTHEGYGWTIPPVSRVGRLTPGVPAKRANAVGDVFESSCGDIDAVREDAGH